MTTVMEMEAKEAPQRVANQLSENKALVAGIVEKIKAFDPKYVVTVGRGTSDHAGVFAKYLIEVELGLPVSSAAPSVSGVYGKQMDLSSGLVLFISQSGRSPDILGQVEMAKKGGAFCVALVNDETSPIKDMVDAVIPLKAGEENAVAATKSYLTTLSAILQLVATWADNAGLLAALDVLPQHMQETVDAPQQIPTGDLQHVNNCVVLGRGFGYAVSLEIALKLKEVCAIHAEAFSSAEFLHGPVTLAEQELTILDIPVRDESFDAHTAQVEGVKARGASFIHMAQVSEDIHPRVAPLTVLQRFYLDVEKVALARGVNPDAPPGLKKVTKTL